MEDFGLQKFGSSFFQELFKKLEDPVFVKNSEHQWIYTNNAFEELVGNHELVGKTDADIFSAEQVATFYEGDNFVIKNQKSLTQEEQVGEDCYALVKKMPVMLPDGSLGLLGIIFDITEYRKAQQEVAKLKLAKQQSLTDPLTGLANRRHLEEFYLSLPKSSSNGERMTGVLHIDLDHFKEINDTKGHARGDAVLVCLSRVLQSSVRRDDFVARIGGDEFVVVAKLATTSEMTELAEQIITALGKPQMVDGESCKLSVSVGIAVGLENQDLNSMLKFADIALYRAKNTGRNRHELFTSELLQEHEESRRRRDEFREGIESGHFFPVYQPQFDTKTLEILGIEALARWDHPTRGVLPPVEFLDLANAEKRLLDLDLQILIKAVDDINHLNSMGMPVPPLSVNISAQTIETSGFVDHISSLIAVPSGLSFELVESMLLDEPSGTISSNLVALRELGVRLDIDDFGSGHASLLGLLAAEPDRVKIDKRLVIPMVESQKHRDLVRSIIQIAASLGMDSVAEGVESEEHRQMLEEFGCRAIQGFGFARPMPIHDLQSLLLRRAA